MAFPLNPNNGDKANVNGVTYTYSASLTAWTVSSDYLDDFSGNLIIVNNATVANTVSSTNINADIGTFTGPVRTSYIPLSANDLTNKSYVDEVAEGLKVSPAAHAATTVNLSATYYNGANNDGVGATLTSTVDGEFGPIDGVSDWSTSPPTTGVLVKDQTNAWENGRYNVSQLGNVSAPWILTRCIYCDESDEIPGSYVFVTGGTLYAGTGWVALVDDPATFQVGVGNILYVQFSGAGTYSAGTGLTLDGTQFSVNASQTQITEVGTLSSLTVSGNVTAGNLTSTNLGTPISGILSNCTVDGTSVVGFRVMPQVSQSTNYGIVLTDSGKHILHPSADTSARTWTIPANSNVAFPLGTAITFVNQNGAGNITIAITTDTMRLAGAGTTGSRTLAANGVATAIKITATEWIISGINLT